MTKQERIDWQQAEVDARRADFLSHVEHCEDCRADLRGDNGGRLTCGELVPILRGYEHAQKLLAELLLPIIV